MARSKACEIHLQTSGVVGTRGRASPWWVDALPTSFSADALRWCFAGAGRDARRCRGVARGGRNAEARQEARGARHGRRASVDRPPVCSWTARGFARSGGTIVSGPVAIPHVESPWLSKNRLRGRPYTQFSSSFSLQLKRERRRELSVGATSQTIFAQPWTFHMWYRNRTTYDRPARAREPTSRPRTHRWTIDTRPPAVPRPACLLPRLRVPPASSHAPTPARVSPRTCETPPQRVGTERRRQCIDPPGARSASRAHHTTRLEMNFTRLASSHAM